MKARAKLLLLLLPPLLLSGLLIKYLAGHAVRDALREQVAVSARAGATSVPERYAAAFVSGGEAELLPALYALKDALKASEAAFVGVSGELLAHTDVARKGAPLPAAWKEKLGLPEGGYDAPGGAADLAVFIPVLSQAAKDPEELALGSSGGELLGTLVASVPLAAAAASERRISRRITLILLAVYSAILLAAFFVTGLALRPVQLLTEGTKRIRLGDYGSVIPVSSHDEFGELASSFNEMTRTLSGTIVSKNYLDAIVDNIVDILVVTDLEGRISRVNKAALAAFGKTAEELQGAPARELFRGEQDPQADWLRLLAAEGQVRDYETRLNSPVLTPALISASYIRDTEGAPSGIAVIVRDITLRKKYEAELARSNEDLQRFAFVASHDLQEPLRTVTNYIQLLETKYRETLGPDAARNVDFITAAVKRMRSLVRDLLEYSKLNAGLKLERVDSGEALDSVLALMRDTLNAAGARVERGTLPVIDADRGHIERLLQNLLSNAVKFTGGRAPLVTVSAARGPEGWVFSVADNGEGIDAKYAHQLFKLFGRLHGAAVAGAGIGLASCKRIVDSYGGRIWFDSEPGKGSTFYFSVPPAPEA
jgi:PAS domain S-box-containing protein